MAVAVSSEQQADSFVHSAHKLLIDGEWVEAASGKTFPTINPATEETLAEVAHGEAEDIDRAVRAARRAFDDDSPWRRMNASDRGRLIWRIADLIEEHGDELAMLESLDNGKPFAIARAADVALAADLFRYMAGWPTKIEGTTVPISALPAPGEYLAYTLREPVGVVGQIIPWNFPLLMAAWKLGPVLACACTVVLKPAEQTPLSALRLGELLQEAGLPAGVVNIVTGFGDAGAALAAHDDVDKVAFTGSTEVGKLIVKAAAGNLKKVSLELGGKSPNVVYADADLDSGDRRRRERRSSSTTASAATRARACTCRSDLRRRRRRRARRRPSTIKVAPGTDAGLADGPADLRRAVREGARLPGLRAGGRRPGRRRRRIVFGDRGYFVQPTCSPNTSHDMKVVREEIFGPVVCAIPFDSPDEIVARRQRHQLRAGRGRVHPRHLEGPPHRQAAARRNRVDQHLPRVRRRDAVRRLQGVGLGPRDGSRGAQQLPRDEVRRNGALSPTREPMATVRPARTSARGPGGACRRRRRAMSPMRHPGRPHRWDRDSILDALRSWVAQTGAFAPASGLVRRAAAGRAAPLSASGWTSIRGGRAARAWPHTSARGARRSMPPACRAARSPSRSRSPTASRRRGGWPPPGRRSARSPISSGCRFRASTTTCAHGPAPTAEGRSRARWPRAASPAPRTCRQFRALDARDRARRDPCLD